MRQFLSVEAGQRGSQPASLCLLRSVMRIRVLTTHNGRQLLNTLSTPLALAGTLRITIVLESQARFVGIDIKLNVDVRLFIIAHSIVERDSIIPSVAAL